MFLKEEEVAVFLSGDEAVDDHGAACGDGFLYGGAAAFADDDVVGHEEVGHFCGPVNQVDAVHV